jgi:DNA-binding MarR family transcriptional regulator
MEGHMAERRPPAFRNLLGYQVSHTADALRRSSAMCMRREHDLSLAQVRALALIEHLQPVRLRDVAADAGADKAQISRVVSSLVERGYVTRRALPGDARSAHLELTGPGRDKYCALIKTLEDRDGTLRAAFDKSEVDMFAAFLMRARKAADKLSMEEERLGVPQSSSEAVH